MGLTDFIFGKKKTTQATSPVPKGQSIPSTRLNAYSATKKAFNYISGSPDPKKPLFTVEEALISCPLFNAEAVKIIVPILQRQRSTNIYGSIAEKMWLGENMKRPPRNVNIFLEFGYDGGKEKRYETMAQELVDKLTPIYRTKIRLGTTLNTLVEMQFRNKWVVAFDIFDPRKKSLITKQTARVFNNNYIGEGLERPHFNDSYYPSKDLGGIRIWNLRYLGAYKACSVLAGHSIVVMPDPDRLPDIIDMITIFKFKAEINKQKEEFQEVSDFLEKVFQFSDLLQVAIGTVGETPSGHKTASNDNDTMYR